MRAGAVIARTFGLGALALTLVTTTGCVRFGAKPPQQLLSVASEARVVAGQPQTGPSQDALYVELPAVPRTIATQRVAVRENATSYAYVKKALWADTPARQFQALLNETLVARGGLLVLDPGQYPAQMGRVLHGDLLEFGVNAAERVAVVTYDANVLAADGKTIRRQRFSATRPLGTIDANSVAPAISAAANEVAASVTDWLKSGM